MKKERIAETGVHFVSRVKQKCSLVFNENHHALSLIIRKKHYSLLHILKATSLLDSTIA